MKAAWSSPTTPIAPAVCSCSSTRPGATAILQPDHYFLALNYRMTELQGAVAGAQLDKLEDVVDRRIALAEQLTSFLPIFPASHPARSASATCIPIGSIACASIEQVVLGGTVALGAAS